MSQKVLWYGFNKGRLIADATATCDAKQKVVQARMWSQGITIGVVIAAAAVTRSRIYRRDEGDVGRPVNQDHSWREVIQLEEGESV